MPEPNWNAIAQAAYEAYAHTVRTDAQPLAVPEWEDLPPRYQEGWREAAKRACETLNVPPATLI